MPDFRWTKSGCRRGPFRKRPCSTLNMVCTCLCLAALGLVSLAGGQVRDPSHLKTAPETIQVFQHPANIRSRSLFSEDLSIRRRFPDLEMSREYGLTAKSQAPRQHLLSAQSQTWTMAFGGCTFSGDYAGAPLVRTGSCPTQGGTLDLQGKGITSVPPDAFLNMPKMTYLHLFDNQLSALPPGVFAGLSSLVSLSLNSNQLSALPPGVFAGLSSLQMLRLDNNQLQCAPISAQQQSALSLYQGPVTCTSIPWTMSFGGCSFSGDYAGAPLVRTGSCPTQGGYLDLQRKGITSVQPDAFQNMSQMTYLSLNSNRLSDLPPGVFAGLSSLGGLGLNNNTFSALAPDIFAGLSSLQQLWLSHNKLSVLPPGVFAGLSSLQSLGLDNNQLSALPPGVFAGLSSLVSLSLNSNQLSALPPGVFAGLSSLQDLVLGHNRLSALPPGVFSGLSSLGTLRLDNNQLQCAPISAQHAPLLGTGRYQGPVTCTSIPWTMSFGGCTFSGDYAGAPLVRTGSCPTQGGSLDLQYKFITSVPPDAFLNMPQMTYLHLFDNQLSALPPGVFAGLSSLVSLSLNSNQLSALPPGVFAGLSSLQGLVLDSNQLSALPPGIFSGCSSLGQLWLSNNKLSALPPGVFAGLSSLWMLYLSNNPLPALQTDIFAGLSSLGQLWLNNNQLSALPPNIFAGLSSLHTLHLENNQLQCAPISAQQRSMLGAGRYQGPGTCTSIPWTMSFGGCTFSGDYAGAPLVRTGSCPTQGGYLDLSYKCITSVQPDAFQGMPQMTYLDLSYNQLSALSTGVFAGLSSLQQLSLSNNQLSALPPGVFDGLSSLGYLGLDGNQLLCTLAGSGASTTCTCNAGSSGPNFNCTACVAGKYKALTGSAPCSDCPSETPRSPTGSVKSSDCTIPTPSTTPTTPAPSSWGSALFASCELQYSLQQLLQREKAGLPPRHRTGGLGVKMQPSIFEAWVCVDQHDCSSSSAPMDGWFCWVIDERIALPKERAPDQYVPWGHNGHLKLFSAVP